MGLLGPNGAGKSTSFYMIVGFIKSNGGKIFINDMDISAIPMYKRAANGLSYLPQNPSVIRNLNVWDNIHFVSEIRKDLNRTEQKELTQSLVEEFGLTRLVKQKASTLSGGERRRVEIARSLATAPKFLLLDEPFAGIDPKAVHDIKQIVMTLAKGPRSIGVIITDHNIIDAMSITDINHIVSDGQILCSGTKAELLANPLAREVYFGEAYGE